MHDIGKNLVDIILTNNGYTVKNLGIKVGIADMVSALEESDADAIGMSGLLVKSTLIMRDNLEELNRRNLSHIPVILGGAALTRTYVERDLRQVYNGRLFYGKDAFEGLRTMDRLVELTAQGKRTPNSAPPSADVTSDRVRASCASRQQLRPWHGVRLCPPARPRWRWTTRPSSRLSSAAGWPKGCPSTTSPPISTRPLCSATSGAFGPRVARTTPPSRTGSGPCCVSSWPRPRPGSCSSPKWPGSLRRQRRRQRARAVRGREPQRRAHAVHLPPPERVTLAVHQRLLPVSRLGRTRLGQFPGGDHGCPGIRGGGARLKADNQYQNYLYLHGLGVEMAEALAEYWHRRIREELGFAVEDGPTLTGLFRQKYRGGRYSWGYPACPDLEDNAKVVDLLGADRIGIEVSEGFQLHPEQSTTAIICHHPQAKYFVA